MNDLLEKLMFIINPKEFVPNPDIVNPYNKAYEFEQYKREGRVTEDTKKILSGRKPQYNTGYLTPEDVYQTIGDKKYYERIPTGYELYKGQAIGTPEEVARERKYDRGIEYALSYPGTRFTPELLNMLRAALDADTFLRSIAIAQAETGMGKTASSFKNDNQLKERNWWGFKLPTPEQPSWPTDWYDPPTWEQMIEDINRNIGPEGRFGYITPEVANLYTAGDKTDNWLNIVTGALQQMGY